MLRNNSFYIFFVTFLIVTTSTSVTYGRHTKKELQIEEDPTTSTPEPEGADLFDETTIVVTTTIIGDQNPNSSIPTESFEEVNSDEGSTTNDEHEMTKYRLDYFSDVPEESPFASYQFEKKVPIPTTTDIKRSKNSSTIVNVSKTTTTSSSPSKTQSIIPPVQQQSEGPAIIPLVNPEEDESEPIGGPTTPFTVDSLGNVVKITNNEDDDSSEEQCDEGEVKKDKCNTCVCTDGVFFCSKKPCPDKNDSDDEEENANNNDHHGHGHGSSSHHHGEHEFYNDDAAVHEIMNKVSVLGSASHTNGVRNKWSYKKRHPTPNSSSPPAYAPDCTNGMTKSIDCNNCICAKGKWACTKTSCIALTLREKASYTDGTVIKKVDGLKENHHLDEDCLEGSTREDNCNQCVCHYNSWSCTSTTCSSTTPPPKIKEIEEACQVEGDVKSKECNLCKCKRGVWVCTTNNCMVFGIAKIPYIPPKFRTTITKN